MTPDQFTAVALSNPDITQNIAQNASYRPELQRCIDVLADTNEAKDPHDVVSTVLKAHDAIINGIKIFVSYKFSTRSTPATLLAPFTGHARIHSRGKWPFAAETSIRIGDAWNADIFDALAETHWFFQILPNESADRYWVSFEAGHYHGTMKRGVDRLICIHHPSVELAGPLRTFKPVVGDIESIRAFLDELLRKPNAIPGMEPIHAKLSDADLSLKAQAIADGMNQTGGNVTRQYLIKYLDLALDAAHPPQSVDELLEFVVTNSLGADRLFNYIASDATGAKFKNIVLQLESYGEANMIWLTQFLQSINAVYSKLTPGAIYAEFRAADGCYYRPQMHAIRRREADGSIESVHLVFHEVMATPVERAPVELDTLQTAFQLAYRTRWELLEEYDGKLKTKADLEKLERVLLRMEIESEQRGLWRRSIVSPGDLANNPLVKAFAPEQRDAIIALYSAYGEIRNPQSKDGLLDKAFTKGDVGLAQEAMEKVRGLNCTFVKLAAERLPELIKRRW